MKSLSVLKRALLILVSVITVAVTLPIAEVSAAEKPEILSSKSAILYCIESDTVLFSHLENERVHPGVMTKLMVAVVVADELQNKDMTFDSTVTASRKAISSTRGKHIAMKTGEVFVISDLISVMLHADADDAANVLAEAIADDNKSFVSLMNQKAADLGMENTYYASVTATEDTESYTTVSDQVLLASHALRNPDIARLADQIRAVVRKTNMSNARYYGTSNYLLSTRVDPDYYLSSATGMVCGNRTDAGYCAIVTSRKDGLNYIAVTAGGTNSRILVSEEHEDVDEDGNPIIVPAVYKTVYHGLHEARALLSYGEKSFSYVKAVDTAMPITDLPVKLGLDIDRVSLLPEFDLEIFVSNDSDLEKDITYKYVLDSDSLTAPVKAGQRAGTLYVLYKGEQIGEVPLIVKANIERDGLGMILKRAKALMKTPFFIVLMILTVFALVFYVLSNAVSRQKKISERKRLAEREKRYLGSGKGK